jgi:hypothetical protein
MIDLPSKDRMHNSTFQHNVKVLRGVLAEWGRTQVELGTPEDWDSAASDLDLPKSIGDVTLWIDSVDFPLTRKKDRKSKRGRSWSFKCNGPGQRYTFIRDGNSRIIKKWGGYSPKVYDGDFLKINKDWMERRLNGGVIIADQHYAVGKKIFKNVKFHVAHRTPPKPRDEENQTAYSKLTKEQEKYNANVANVRARIENTFGILTQKFQCLQKPFAEDEGEMDKIVEFATGVFNATKDLK